MTGWGTSGGKTLSNVNDRSEPITTCGSPGMNEMHSEQLFKVSFAVNGRTRSATFTLVVAIFENVSIRQQLYMKLMESFSLETQLK
jgi:hypothetical protein